MTLFVECKSDETLAVALEVPQRSVEHASGAGAVCSQLARRRGVMGMLDEDPGSAAKPYLKSKSVVEQSWEHEIRFLTDTDRENRIVILSPRLEEWVLRTAKSESLKMTDFGFESDNGVQLHGEINQRLPSLRRLITALVEKKNKRILLLRGLLAGNS